jgi:assimilatory nitrate reductase catalytic subunit
MGYGGAFNYQGANDIFSEHARLSGHDNNGKRDFDISALSALTEDAYNALVPVQWPVSSSSKEGTARLFTDGHFFTASGKAQLITLQPKQPVQKPDEQHPFWLSTGRVRDQWHTMTRTARSARLLSHIEEPFVAIHPEDMLALGLRAGQLVKLSNHFGECHLPVVSDAGQQRGQLFSPIHWNDQFASKARIDSLVAPVVDPKSGQPEYKQVAVSIEPMPSLWHGQLFSLTGDVALPEHNYWCRIPGNTLSRMVLAGNAELSLTSLKATWANAADQWAEMADPASHHFRLVGYKNGKPTLAFIAAKERKQIDSVWLEDIFSDASDVTSPALAIAYGSPLCGGDTTPIICSCHRVRQSVIDEAIQQGAVTAEAVGACTRAGTNCGSCIPEVKSLIATATAAGVKEQQS